MSLEAATFITDLDANNPAPTDLKNQGDDHIRLIKSVLKNTFPGASGAASTPKFVQKNANYTAVLADDNTTFICDTSLGSFTITLPNLTFDPDVDRQDTEDDSGRECGVRCAAFRDDQRLYEDQKISREPDYERDVEWAVLGRLAPLRCTHRFVFGVLWIDTAEWLPVARWSDVRSD